MKGDSRVHKSFLNARINLICYFATLVVSFFTRKVLIDNLGVDFLGLSGTLLSLLGFLNLAELGIGGAISYVLFKPLAESDKFRINEIVSVLGFLYRCIGFFILGAGVILSFFIPLIFSDTPFSWGVLYFGFYAFLFSSVLGYVVNYKSVLLSADQRNYVVTGYYQISTVAKVLLQMYMAMHWRSFYVYFALEFLFAVVNSIILNLRINKAYPWLKTEVRKGRLLLNKYPEIVKYIKQIIFHQVGSFAQGQLSPFLVYSFVNLTVVGLYGNYNMVVKRIENLIKGILDSTSAGVGNLIASSSRDHIYQTFKELLSIRCFVGGVLASCMLYLINPFIQVWLGSQYVMSEGVALLMIVAFFISLCRNIISQFATGFGLFYDIWAPLVETGIFLVVALVGGYFWGIYGILVASIVSIFSICYVWRAYFIFSKGFHLPVIRFWGLFVLHIVCLILSFYIARLVSNSIIPYSNVGSSWTNWIVSAVIFTSTNAVVSLLLFYATSGGFRYFIHRFLKKRKNA